ncbi:hypothetical protein AAVH_22442 [Aphelenchoides avenae]|nr:hypothetical protein AAVH_22442 [Aphelenchus avenae]
MSLRLGLLRSMSVEAPARTSTQKKAPGSKAEARSTESSTSPSPVPQSRSAYSYFDCNGYEMRMECKKGAGYEFYRCRYARHCRGRASSEKGSSVLKQTVPHNHPPKCPPESMRPKQKKRGRPPKPKEGRISKKVTCEVAEVKQKEANVDDVPIASAAGSCLSSPRRSGTNHSTSESTRNLPGTEEGNTNTSEESSTTDIGMELASLLGNFVGVFEPTVHRDASKSTKSSPEATPAHEDPQAHPAEPTPAAMNEASGHREKDAEELRAQIFVLQNEVHQLRRASGIGSGRASFESPSTSATALNLQLQRQLASEETARMEVEQKYKQCVQDSKKIIEERDRLQKDYDKLAAEAKQRQSAAAEASCSSAACEKKLKDAEAKSRGWEGQFHDMQRKYETLKASMVGATSANGVTKASSSKAVEKIPEKSDVQSFKQKYEEERRLREKFQEVLANMTTQSAPAEPVDTAELKRDLELIKESSADYMTRCRKAEEELAKLRELKGPAVELSRRLECTGRQLGAIMAAKHRLQTTLDERNAELQELRERNDDLQSKQWKHATEQGSLAKKLKQATDKCEALEKNNNELKTEHAALKEKYAKMLQNFRPTLKKHTELLRRRACLNCLERKIDKPPQTADRSTATSSSTSHHAVHSSGTRSQHNEANVQSNDDDQPSTSSRAYVPLRHAPTTTQKPFDEESPRSPSPMPSSPPSLECFISSQVIERPLTSPRSPSPAPGASLTDNRSERGPRLNDGEQRRKRPRNSLDDSPPFSDEEPRDDDERKSSNRRKQSRLSKEPVVVITLSDEDDDVPADHAAPREDQNNEDREVPESERSTGSRSAAERDLSSQVKDLAERARQLFPESFNMVAQEGNNP